MILGLDRFVEAQDRVLDQVRRELSNGRKTSHWMWFVFPQLAGLGRSETARVYGLVDIEDARAYLAHPILGPRLRECVGLATRSAAPSAHALFGFPDDLKFRSCLTLFAAAAEGAAAKALFEDALARFYGGVGDPATLRMLEIFP